MSDERAERCECCRFWEREEDDKIGVGDCRRYPPAMALVQTSDCLDDEWTVRRPAYNGGFPITFEDDWCGEFQPTAASTQPASR